MKYDTIVLVERYSRGLTVNHPWLLLLLLCHQVVMVLMMLEIIFVRHLQINVRRVVLVAHHDVIVTTAARARFALVRRGGRRLVSFLLDSLVLRPSVLEPNFDLGLSQVQVLS